ncbi:CpsD/CapB family tyrosine-protein kinase [Intestinimonas butyriciproducens]
MVSSTLPGEGKTTVAVNLALTLSQNGARVILVDLDLRKPSVKRCLGVSVPSRGAPELLNLRGADPREHLLTLEGTQVRLLAGDEPSSNPRRQMESRRLEALLTTLREEADYVILDTPPCGLLGDGAALAGLADASLYVVRSGTAQVSHILDSLQFLAGSGTPLMGCVLNGASGGGGRYGYGYGYGYGGDHYGKYHAYRQEK